MSLPVAYSLHNWTASLSCGKVGAQQIASLGGILKEFTPPDVTQIVIDQKFAGVGGNIPIPTGCFDKMECGFKLSVTSDSLEAAIARGIAGTATLVITSVANSTLDINNTKVLSYTLVGQVTKMPYVFGLKAQELAEAEFMMSLISISKAWGSTTRSLNAMNFELMEGLTNFLADLKTGMNI